MSYALAPISDTANALATAVKTNTEALRGRKKFLDQYVSRDPTKASRSMQEPSSYGQLDMTFPNEGLHCDMTVNDARTFHKGH